MEEKPKKPKKYKDPTVPLKYAMIERLAEVPETAFAKKIFYPRELKIAHELWKKYTEDFWTKITLPYKVKSIASFLNGRGAEDVEKKWKEYNFVPTATEQITYADSKIGEDFISIKPPSLLDFLKSKR